MTEPPAPGQDKGDERNIRRARCLVVFWQDGQTTVENYLTGTQTVVEALVLHFLQALEDWQSPAAIRAGWAAIPRAAEVLDRLIARDAVVVEGTPLALRDESVDATWQWATDARYFHFATRNVPYEPSLEAQRASLVELARRIPPPPPFSSRTDRVTPLPGSFAEPGDAFWRVLLARRTRRRFSGAPIARGDFATLLLWTWGQTETIAHPEIGRYVLKTSPSGGARHPIEVYPIALRVEGVAPGVYHYSVERHGLECLRPGALSELAELVVRLFANQDWVREAAAVFLMTAVIGRSMWKYRHSHAYRVLLLDAGHLGQTFQLAATALGLAPATSSAMDVPEVERTLELDGVSEIVVYAAAVGVPA